MPECESMVDELTLSRQLAHSQAKFGLLVSERGLPELDHILIGKHNRIAVQSRWSAAHSFQSHIVNPNDEGSPDSFFV